VIFRALACDYDGSLATHDRIGSEALRALVRAREAGLRLILVTGRVFFELIRVCERLDLFDVVVAENCGILYFPGSGTIRNLAHPSPSELLSELERRALFFRVGRTIVDMARSDAEHARQALTATQTRMDLVFNRGSLMLLPPGISKGTGVRGAMQALGLTGHEVLALGDAENDLDFFEVCDWRACPENAVAELKQHADWVFPGVNGAAIAHAIVEDILPGRLAVARSPRHQLMIGWATRSGELVEVPERDVNVLIQGDPVSGKSWLAGLLAERLVERRYGVCVIDPEGDYSGLAALPGTSWSDVADGGAVMEALQRFEQEPGASSCWISRSWTTRRRSISSRRPSDASGNSDGSMRPPTGSSSTRPCTLVA
jgi:hydroxymethylpyrimidine pyrophosphatase-like HAD family hydrolase